MLYGDRGSKVGTRIPYKDFATASRDLLKEDRITERACQYTLQQMQKERSPFPGTALKVGKDEAWLDWTSTRVFDERVQHRPEVKLRLARLAWHLLFGINFSGDHLRSTVHGSSKAQRQLANKIDELRKKSPVGLLIDAGSSTIKFCEELIALPAVPFKVKAGNSESHKKEAYRLVSPHVTTNCPEIATMIGGSSHSSNIGVTVVGGDQRSERGSICGTLALLWMAHVNPFGDVALVGATGYRRDPVGTPSFGSDNHEEAELKAAFLARAWLKVIVLDSSKFAVQPVSRVFASLPEIDLVITDDGEDVKEYKTGVAEFLSELDGADVVAHILGTDN